MSAENSGYTKYKPLPVRKFIKTISESVENFYMNFSNSFNCFFRETDNEELDNEDPRY